MNIRRFQIALGVVIAANVATIVVACMPHPDKVKAQQRENAPPVITKVYGPDALGVACYSGPHANNFSCVKVQ